MCFDDDDPDGPDGPELWIGALVLAMLAAGIVALLWAVAR